MLTVSIQAGGRSSRMGRDKALVSLNGVAMIERVLHRVRDLGQETIITTNDPERYSQFGVRLVPDPQPGAGALHGLLTALRAASYGRVLIVGCDMPFLSRPLLRRLIDLAPRAEVVVPRDDSRFEPLVAVYSRSCIPPIEQHIARGEQRMISFFSSVELLTIDEQALDRLDPDRLSFFNVNTPQDLRRAEELLAQTSG